MSDRPLIDRLRTYVRKRFYAGHNADAAADEDTRPLNHIDLTHLVADDRDVQLEAFPVRLDADDSALDMLAARIEQAAHDHCDGLPGVQRYRLAAYYQGSNVPNGAITFALRAVADQYTGTAVTEPANERGLLAQLMRSMDAKDRLLLAHTSQMAGYIEKQGEIIDTLTSRHFDFLRLTEEMLSSRHDRDLATKRETARIEQRGELVRSLRQLAPAIVNRVAGKDVIPGAKGMVENELARGLIETISAAQADAIAQVLPDDELRAEWIALLQLAQENRELPLHEPLKRFAAKLPRPVLFAIAQKLTPMQQVSISELLGLRQANTAASSATRH